MRAAVTGAFGYSGRYITGQLLARGEQAITLTNSTARPNPWGSRVAAYPFHFDDPIKLEQTLQGVDALVNTYWVRFNHRLFTHDQAVANTKVLFEAAKRAGVRRIVHVSITNPDLDSALPYFRGKAELERFLQQLGVSYCILRPTVLFGKEDVLINNIAWALRHLPVFGLFGAGDYRLQPIYVEDLATAAAERTRVSTNEIIEAIGPETYTYRELVEMIANKLGLHRIIMPVAPKLGLLGCRLLGGLKRDVVITPEEIRGLMANKLHVDAQPLGRTRLSEWVEKHKDSLGRKYTSEMARRMDRKSSYKSN